MKATQSSGMRPVHQPVAGALEFKTNGKAIAIAFTDQQLSGHAGSATFWGWLRPLDWATRLAAALPHRIPTSNNKLLPLEKALAFMHGLLCDARKLTHVAYLRRDPLAPELLGIQRIASQSVLTRFFRASPRPASTCAASGRSGIGAWIGCPARATGTRSTWIPRACSTRTAIRREWPWVIPNRASNPVCIRCWP